jgi:hypothetical protein
VKSGVKSGVQSGVKRGVLRCRQEDGVMISRKDRVDGTCELALCQDVRRETVFAWRGRFGGRQTCGVKRGVKRCAQRAVWRERCGEEWSEERKEAGREV